MADLDKVNICHPRIDEGKRVVSVPRAAYEQHHARAGWQLAEPSGPDGDPQDDPPPGDQPQTTEAPEQPPGASALQDDKPAARRRTSKEGE